MTHDRASLGSALANLGFTRKKMSHEQKHEHGATLFPHSPAMPFYIIYCLLPHHVPIANSNGYKQKRLVGSNLLSMESVFHVEVAGTDGTVS